MFKWFMLLIHLFRAYGALLYANLGDTVTLPCFYPHSARNLCWYKQVAGEQPQIISSVYAHSSSYNELHGHFKNDTRLSFEGSYKLKISNVRGSDSALYFCGETTIKVTKFSSGTLLAVKDSNCFSFLKQPASDSVQQGGSVTLNCTLTTGTSDGEHRVYWFKDAGKPNPGIMYVHTNSSSQCVKAAESESPARSSCVYNLWKENVGLFDDGMYYCAVASCGAVLFGEGTRLNVEETDSLPVWVYVAAALLLSVIVNITLICVLCKMAQRLYLHSRGSHSQHSVAVRTTETQQNEQSDDLQYVALDYSKRPNKSRRQRNKEEETVYSGVRLMERE